MFLVKHMDTDVIDAPCDWKNVLQQITTAQRKPARLNRRRHFVITNDDAVGGGHHWFLTLWDDRKVKQGECVYMWDSHGSTA